MENFRLIIEQGDITQFEELKKRLLLFFTGAFKENFQINEVNKSTKNHKKTIKLYEF